MASVRYAGEPPALDGALQHLLMAQARTGVRQTVVFIIVKEVRGNQGAG